MRLLVGEEQVVSLTHFVTTGTLERDEWAYLEGGVYKRTLLVG